MIEKIIAEVVGCDQDIVKDDVNFVKDLGYDSLNVVELVMQIEEEYEIEIPDEDAEELHTVKDLKKYIEDYA
jgi:acyl carrier protein|tara:strand:- start:82 stop:297 length:216 start_codon:yes stop_codon:yes gene_type:complete